MDFKERFKGRTTNMKKEGFMETFAATTNPVTKSQSNSQLPSASKISSTVTYDFQAHNIPSQRHIAPPSVENRTHGQGYPPHSYSKSPVGHSQNQNTSIQQNSLSHSNSATKSPYLVSNPFPSYYVQENQQENYENGVGYHRLNPKNIANQINNQQPMPSNEFNPNSFYNQHSQFRKNGQDLPGSPFKENIERQGYGYGNTNQLLKKNFEDLSQQNKQKRLAGEVLRGFDNQNTYYQMPSNQYGGGYDHVVPEYNIPSNNPGFPVNGYNGPRNIHSNPVPHEHLESDAFGYAGNVTHQIPRGRQQENYTEGSKTLGYSKTSYKPYNLREYKDLKKAPTKLGGLGPNINTEEWQKTKEKKNRMAEFSQNVKMFNAQRTLSTESAFKPRREKEKEVSKREVALQFAKNIPKPRAKRDQSQDEEYPDMELHKSKSDKPVHSGGHNDLDEFEQRHMQYLAQLERMKLN